jgi:hypothetical protein
VVLRDQAQAAPSDARSPAPGPTQWPGSGDGGGGGGGGRGRALVTVSILSHRLLRSINSSGVATNKVLAARHIRITRHRSTVRDRLAAAAAGRRGPGRRKQTVAFST